MSSADEAPTAAPEVRPEKEDQSPKHEAAQIAEQTEAREATKSPTEPRSSPSPSNAPAKDEPSEAKHADADTAAATADETQPPLPNEPLPDGQAEAAAPPLPNEPVPSADADPDAPPLPAEPVPEPEDDGWEFHWNPNDQSYWFYNRFTGVWQQENPRVPDSSTAATTTSTTAAATTAPAADASAKTALSNPASIAGGYNPAIHGSYDENAWYAQNLRATTSTSSPSSSSSALGPAGLQLPPPPSNPYLAAPDASLSSSEQQTYLTEGFFNRHTGQWQRPDQGAERHSDEARARRQLRAYFDVDAAANTMHDGRSLKAERAGIKPSRAELRAFKERRRQKKEEKRRAWLRD